MTRYLISCCAADVPEADKFVAALRNKGLDVAYWADDIPAHQDFIEWMRQRANDCPVCLAIWSANYSAAYNRFSLLERNVYLNQTTAGREHYALLPIRLDETPVDILYGNIPGYDAASNSFSEIAAAIRDNHRQIIPSRRSRAAAASRTRVNTAPVLMRQVIGRTHDVDALRQDLATRNAAALTAIKGSGGVGKSTLALHYIHEHGNAYAGIAWIGAETEPELAAGFRKLAARLNLQIPQQAKPVDIAEALIAHIEDSGDPWLVVFDNAANPKAVAPYLSNAPNIHTIVTSRHSDWPGAYTTRDVAVLGHDGPDSPAVRLLAEESGRDDDPDGALALARELGGLPLALVLAGASLRQSALTFADYAREWESLLDATLQDGSYDQTIRASVKLSCDACSDDARALLDLFAWLATDLIEARLVGDLAGDERFNDAVPDSIKQLAVAPARLAAAMTELRRRSLLTGAAEPFSLHRLSAAAIRALQGDAAPNRHAAAAAVVAARYPQRSDLHATWDQCRRLTPHVLALAARDPLPQTRAVGWLLNQASLFLRDQAQTGPAIDLARKSLDITTALHGPDHRSTGAGHSQLGNCLGTDNQLDEAEAALAEAVRIGEKNADRKDDLAINYSNHGGVLQDLARRARVAGDAGAADAYFARAKNRYEAALAIGRDLHGPDSRQVGTRLNNLAALHAAMGDRPAAIGYARDALAIEEAAQPPDPPSLGYRQSNLGAYLLQNGDLEDAEDMLAQAYDTDSAAYANPAHPNVIGTARWYVIALLMRAHRGQDAAARTARARDIAAAHGIDFEEIETKARLRLAALDRGIEFEELVAQIRAQADGVAPEG